MNIFLTDKNPVFAASHLCDLRLNKMILETAQMLSTAYLKIYSEPHEALYKKTHESHPCTIWAGKCINNYSWLYDYFICLANERYKRFNKSHLTVIKLREVLNPNHEYDINKIDFSFNSSGIYPSSGNVFNDYKLCLLNKWLKDNRHPKWTNSHMPNFITFDLKCERSHMATKSNHYNEVYRRSLITSTNLWNS